MRINEVAPRVLDIEIKGMTCASCVGHVEHALLQTKGVVSASVNLATQRAQITTSQEAASEKIFQAIIDAGYEPVVETLEINIEGMSCASCVAHVESSIKKVPGVIDSQVNLAAERATIKALSNPSLRSNLTKAIIDAGYTPHPFEHDREEQRELLQGVVSFLGHLLLELAD